MTALWKKEFELNLKEVDAQHKQFFKMLEETEHFTEKELLEPEDVFKIFRLVIDLRTYGHHHFYTEEKLMIDAGYPEFLEHLGRHDEFVERMNKSRRDFLALYKAFQDGDENRKEIQEFFRDLFGFVSAWYQEHISNEDAKYAYFMKTKA